MVVAGIARAGLLGVLALAFVPTRGVAAPEMLCPGSVVPLDVSAAQSPFAHFQLGGHDGYFQVDTGSTISTIDAKTFGRPIGSVVALEGSSFPTLARGKFTVLNFETTPTPDGHQAGQIGTDFLRRRTAEFHYEASPPYLVISDQPCSPERLQSAGFIAISQRGYYGDDTRRLGAIPDNAPVVFIRIGSVTVPAWIDTGYRELNSAGKVEVNSLLLQKLRAAGIALRPDGSGRTINCRGEHFDTPGWRAIGVPMEITTERGRTLLTYDAPALVESPRNRCSGPGNVGVPMARIGAAYVHWWQTLVLDSLNERVWISPGRARPPDRPNGRRAIAIASNSAGVFTVTSAPSLDRAKAGALSECNSGARQCTLNSLSIDASEFNCLAVARNLQNRSQLTVTVHPSLEEARKKVIDDCTRAAGGACKVEYSACNG